MIERFLIRVWVNHRCRGPIDHIGENSNFPSTHILVMSVACIGTVISNRLFSGFIVWKYPRSEICEINEDDPIKVCSLTDGQKVTTQGATLR